MIQIIRPDYIFSYWIFGWYLVYMLGWVTPNPKFAIYIALLENLFVLSSMIYSRVNPKKIFYFSIVILLIKVLPLWSLRNSKIKERDIYATVGVFLMYVGWIIWDDKMIALTDAYTQMLDNKIQLPGMTLLNKMFS